MGEVAQAAHQGPLEALQPHLQGLGIGGQGRRIPGGHKPARGGALQQAFQQGFGLELPILGRGLSESALSGSGLNGRGDQTLPALQVDGQLRIQTDRSRRIAAQWVRDVVLRSGPSIHHPLLSGGFVIGIRRPFAELIAGLAQLGQQLPLPTLLLLQPFPADLAGELHQLLHREHAAAALHQLTDAGMQASPLLWGKPAVTLGIEAGCQMKTGLLNCIQQAVAQHLEIEGKIAVEHRIAALQLGVEGAELMAHCLNGIHQGQGRIRPGVRRHRPWRPPPRRSPSSPPQYPRPD